MTFWIAMDGDPYETSQGILHKKEWARVISKKLRKQHPTKKVEVWQGWVIK